MRMNMSNSLRVKTQRGTLRCRLLIVLLETHQLPLEMKFDNVRGFYIRLPLSELEGRVLPSAFTNIFRRKNNVECQTLDLMKTNQKVLPVIDSCDASETD